MNPMQLYYAKGNSAGWTCGCCLRFTGVDLDWAERCCKCAWKGCSEPAVKHSVYCEAHREEHKQAIRNKATEEERECFEKAQKIPAGEYQGEMIFAGHEYYPEIEDYLEACDEVEPKKYVWATKKVYPEIDVDDLLQCAVENLQCDELDSSYFNHVEEFKEFVRQWLAKNDHVHCFYPDYSTAILVPQEQDGNRQ